MILTVLVLVPTAVLFGRVWTDNADLRDNTELEKKGVEYITALTPLVSALAESQSTALAGVAEPPETLAAAVAGVSAVDGRIGDQLRTKERWADIKAKIGKLPDAAGAVNKLNTHIEVTDLTLALYTAVQRNSKLSLDPDADVSSLQQAVATYMPRVTVEVNRTGDYANLLQVLPAASRPQIQAQFGYQVIAVQESVKRLTEALQAAVDNTTSATLSSSLVNALDSFRRGIEQIIRGADPTGGQPSAATITTAQTTLQGALSNLAGVTLRETDRLLDDRLDSLSYRRGEAIAIGVLALLLVAGALVWPTFSRRREATPAAPADQRPIGESTRDVALDRPGGTPTPYGAAPPPPYGAPSPYGQSPGYGELDPTRGERSGALR
ncbi:hypothetical protein [Paractinoplanes brasiliensis]|uniref:hypothetical protein n=1 Tax=Paractinoplanes brasiliensis TaxID=52695 RepID=UPI001A56AC3B|nr:hypothetical protein [Actinoplanes brasiliensis]GID28903.1 hypothetical protein Abr02nite_38860 [Actinoplanes brasiliensis]